MELERAFLPYAARALNEADIPAIMNLYSGNPEYFLHCPPSPSRETVKNDLLALPPGKEQTDKHFLGIFDGASLVAVMDLIERYPDEQTALLGLLMVSKGRQGNGLGSFLVDALSDSLRENGYTRLRLGYVKTNRSAQRFWTHHGFSATGAEAEKAHASITIAEKLL